MTTSPRDVGRAAVYAAEDQLSRLLDRGGSVEFFGSGLVLPQQRRFADVASMQAYVDAVLRLPAVSERWPDAGPVVVRERAGSRQAHYEARRAVIAIPLAGQPPRWAAREMVLLHELVHHLQRDRCEAAHGAGFVAAMMHVVDAVLGSASSLILRAAYDGAGIHTGGGHGAH